MSNSSNAKAAFLGMPYGTASNRLKKMLMFKFAQALELDSCFKCGEKIQTVEELSVEHKEPWFDRENGVELFWDLDNIAFSHLGCNRAERNGQEKRRKIGPEGTAWCSSHQDFVPVDKFGSAKDKWNGLRNHCNDCRKARNWDH